MPQPIILNIHLGAHKTATTHMQRSLSAAREMLLESGIRVYGPDYLRNAGRTIPNMFGLGPWARPTAQRRSPAEQLAFLAKGDKRVVLTDENFLGALHLGNGQLALPLYADAGERIAALAEALPDARINLFMAIRRPDRFIESAYSQTLYSGDFLSPDEFRAAHPARSIDWLPIVAGIAAAPKIESLTVWRHEDYDALFTYLMRRMLRWRPGGRVKPYPQRLHQGISAAALDQVMAWRAEGRGGPLAAQARAALPIGEAHPRFRLFSDAESAVAEAAYAAQCAAIAALDRVQFVTPDQLRGGGQTGQG